MQVLCQSSLVVTNSDLPGIRVWFRQRSIAGLEQVLHQTHLNSHGGAIVKALGFLVELELCVVEEVWVVWYLDSREGRLHSEVFFEGHIIAVGLNPALNETEKGLRPCQHSWNFPVGSRQPALTVST